MKIGIEQRPVAAYHSTKTGKWRPAHCLNIGAARTTHGEIYNYTLVSLRPLPRENVRYRIEQIFKQVEADRGWKFT